MNRNDLKEYYRKLKQGQQDEFSNAGRNEKRLLDETFGYTANPDANPSALENLAANIQDMIDNTVGQTDLDFSDDPLSKWDILDFIIRMLTEEKAITQKGSSLDSALTSQALSSADDRDEWFN